MGMKQTDELKTLPVYWAVGVVIILFCGVVLEAAVKHFLEKLPEAWGDWRRAPQAEVYSPDNLYRYINGGAELYLSYGFQDLLSVRYEKAGQQPIKIDIMDMGRAMDAFGVFVHSCEAPGTEIGQGSEYDSGLLTFWKDRYYVSALAFPVNEEKEKMVLELGRIIALSIPAEGALPPLLKLLPEEKRIRDSIRFFHHYIWLNSHFYVSGEDILDMRDDVDAVMAAYGDKTAKYYLLVVSYPGPERARGAGQALGNACKSGGEGGGLFLPGGSRVGFRQMQNRLAVVFNAPGAETTEALLAKVNLEN